MNYDYEYGIHTSLNKDIEHINWLMYKTISVCAYTVNTSGKYPFLQYLLSNQHQHQYQYHQQSLSFPLLPSIFCEEPLVSCATLLAGLLQLHDIVASEFVGYLEHDHGIYLFFDLTNVKINLDDIYKCSPSRFALICEIMNHKHVCNIKINSTVTRFFLEFPHLCFLTNKENDVFENPVVGFVGKSTPEQTQFTFTFGENARSNPAPFGPYFYFSDFDNSIQQGGWSHDRKPEYRHGKLITCNDQGMYCQGGIVRFALFTENIKYVENLPSDPIDEFAYCNTTHTHTQTQSSLTERITDYSGKWASDFNSIYVGHIELDDGSAFKESPLLVIQEYTQQVPLSYHFVNTSLLHNGNYQIA